VWLYHMTKVVPFTEMAHFVFGGNPRRLSKMNDLFISYAYNTFDNKILGTSLDQWLPDKLDLCRELIFSSVADGAIKEIEFEDGQVIDRQWIKHHFDLRCIASSSRHKSDTLKATTSDLSGAGTSNH